MVKYVRRFLKKLNTNDGVIKNSSETAVKFYTIDTAEIVFIKASLIKDVYDRNNIHFWEHHGNNHNDYISLAKKSEILYEKWLDGLNINDMLYDNGCYEIASAYFSENQLIRVSIYPEGFYKLEGDGRHRVVAAQELDIYIPVKIIGEYR